MVLLENNDVRLRALEPADVSVLYKWENDTSIWKISNTYAPFSKYILQKYIENAHQDIFESKQLRLIIEKIIDSTPIGTIDLFDYDPFHKRAGIGILISNPANRNKGYASSSLTLLIDYCFGILHLKQIYCNISADNEISLNLFKKHNFSIAGIKKDWIFTGKEWLDEYLLQLINEETN